MIKKLLNKKYVHRYVIFIFFIVNVFALFHLYKFVNKYLYNTIVFDRNLLYSGTKKPETIDMKKFEKIITEINNKSNTNISISSTNLFD